MGQHLAGALADHSGAPRVSYAWALGAVTACTGLALAIAPLVAEANLIMAYLLGVMLVAVRFGRGPALMASVLSVLAFDFCFVPPALSLAVSDTRYLVTLAIMMLAAVIIGDLAARQRQARVIAIQHEARTRRLYALSQAYACLVPRDDVLDIAVQYLGILFEGQVMILLPADQHRSASDDVGVTLARASAGVQVEIGVAQWVFAHGCPAGPGTATLPGAQGVYVPLVGARGRVGVLGVHRAGPERELTAEQHELLQACASQTALALERALLAEAVQRAEVAAASERARGALLTSVSHNLRTPLAVIMGSLSSILVHGWNLEPETREQLTVTAYHESERLDHLVGQLLAMTRLAEGREALRLEWGSLEEIVGAALTQLDAQLVGRPVAVVVPPDLPLVVMDGHLIAQVVVNLLENALAHTPAATPIHLRVRLVRQRPASIPGAQSARATAGGPAVLVEVTDAGPGLAPGDEGRIFEKFYRGTDAPQRGVGLGLAICREIVSAHGGAIWVEPGATAGASFRFWLPIDDEQPQFHDDERALAQDERLQRKAS